jgi:5,6-dimethylbenzimidazole synthase
MSGPNFSDAFRAQLNELFVWRRDVRRFRIDRLPDGALDKLLEQAALSPSVGLSQPWRFVIVDDPKRRAAITENFKSCNADALNSYSGEQAALYAKLKLAGLDEAPCHLAVFADRTTQTGHSLGRRTMPEMAEYSSVAAVGTLWLAARAQGIGMGWVSILDPERIVEILDVPRDWRFVGYFCLGYPQNGSDKPELEQAGWEHRRPITDFVLHR